MAVSHHSLISSIAAYHCMPYNYINLPVVSFTLAQYVMFWHTLHAIIRPTTHCENRMSSWAYYTYCIWHL